MTLMGKYTKFTPEQQEKLFAVKDTEALIAFTAEYGVELTDEENQQALEYFKTGTLPLNDDDLDMVASGAPKLNIDTPATAAADGRIINLPSHSKFCSCNHLNTWAKSYYGISGYNVFENVKCYRCGKTGENYALKF